MSGEGTIDEHRLSTAEKKTTLKYRNGKEEHEQQQAVPTMTMTRTMAMMAREEGERAAATTESEDGELGNKGSNSITTRNPSLNSTLSTQLAQ